MTNREVLARKSNKELANALAGDVCSMCVYRAIDNDEFFCNPQYDTSYRDGIQQWLEQEAKDDEHN